MGLTEGIEAIKEVKGFIDKVGLNISRVPPKVKKRFIELSNEDFVGDYGMCLLHCLEARDELKKLKDLIYSSEFKEWMKRNVKDAEK